jgi:hypothetical protein
MSAPSKRAQEVSPDGSSQSSIGTLIGELSQDVSRLVRQEVQLAKTELRQDVTRTGRTAGLFGGGGFAGYMTLLFASIAGWWGLANVMDQGWAALIVAGVWAVIGATMFLIGRSQMRRIAGLRRTATTVREVPAALKPNPDHRKGRS